MKFASKRLRSKRPKEIFLEAILIPGELQSLENCPHIAAALSESSSSTLDPSNSSSPHNNKTALSRYPTTVPLRARVMATGTLSATDGTVEHLFPNDEAPLSTNADTTTFSSSSSSPTKSDTTRSTTSSTNTAPICCTSTESCYHENDLNGLPPPPAVVVPTKRPSSSSSSLISRCLEDAKQQLQHQPPVVVFKRTLSSFLRVADLEMDETLSLHSSSSMSSDADATASTTENQNAALTESFPNYHHISVDPPPGIAVDPKERWVVLDNGQGAHAPLAPLAVSALAKSGMTSMYDEGMWTAADGRTAKFLKQKPNAWPGTCTWQRTGGVVQLPVSSTSAADEQEIMVWSGSFKHGLYGSELPAIRSAGIIGMSPEALMELLVDSNRIKEYNKLSLGRTDLLVLQDDMAKDGPFGGVTKIMQAVTKPPLVRKALVFTSLMHVRELDDGSGYKIVTRAVTPPEENAALDNNDNASCSSSSNTNSLANALQSEILLGVNIIKRIEGDENRCLMMCVNHIRSPMVPMMIAKRIGLQAAQNFYHDLRACC